MPAEVDSFVMDSEFLRDPHAILKEIRDQSRIAILQTTDGGERHVITRHADVAQGFNTSVLSSELHRGLRAGRVVGTQIAARENPVLQLSMLNRDGHDHMRLRRLAAGAFTPKRVAEMASFLEITAIDRVAQLRERDEIELISEFAEIIPTLLICHLFGVPEEDIDWLVGLMKALLFDSSDKSEKGAKELRSADAVVSIDTTLNDYAAYMDQLIAEKERNPQNDLLSDLALSSQIGGKMSRLELFAMAGTLLSAGVTTSIQMIATGTALLLKNPSELFTLRNEPPLIESAIEEVLRYEPPLPPGTLRYALDDVSIGGHLIPKDSYVLLSVLAANRDGRVFDDPDKFLVTRKNNPHLTFGAGKHFCLGSHLARLEGRIALSALIHGLPEMSLSNPERKLEWRPVLQRSLTNLWLVPN